MNVKKGEANGAERHGSAEMSHGQIYQQNSVKVYHSGNVDGAD